MNRGNGINVFALIVFLAVWVVLAVLPLFAFGSRLQEWQNLSENSMAHLRQKRFDAAITGARAALALAQKYFGARHENTARSLHILGLIHLEQGALGEAEPLLKGACGILKGLNVPSTSTSSMVHLHAECLFNLARLYHKQKKFDDALTHYLRSLERYRERPPVPFAHLVTIYEKLAAIHQLRENYAQAESYWNTVMDLYGTREATDALRLKKANAASQLGAIYIEMGKEDMKRFVADVAQKKILRDCRRKYKLAETYLKQALETKKEILGPTHQGLSIDLFNLGKLYYTGAQGDMWLLKVAPQEGAASKSTCMETFQKAEVLLKQAIAIDVRHLGKDHPRIAGALSLLGHVAGERQEYAGALLFYRYALKMRIKTSGRLHEDTARAYLDLGRLFYEGKQYKKAEIYLQKVIDICEKGKGGPSLYFPALNYLITIYDAEGNVELAGPLYVKRLKRTREIFGSNHVRTADEIATYGRFCQLRQKYKEAHQCYREALTLFEKLKIHSTDGYRLAMENLPEVEKKM